MDTDGGNEGRWSVQLPQTVGGRDEPRALFVGTADWMDDVVADLGDSSTPVASTVADSSDARNRLTHERFDCVVVADDVPTAPPDVPCPWTPAPSAPAGAPAPSDPEEVTR